jgi:hypothetical protein
MTNSRRKGKDGELELAEALTALTGVTWRRTQQRRGDQVGDVCTDTMPVHVECKRWASGLAGVYEAIEGRSRLHVGGWIGCRLVELPVAIDAEVPFPLVVNATALLAAAMQQAVRDAPDDEIPVVCVRTNLRPWLVFWRAEDTGRMQYLFGVQA